MSTNTNDDHDERNPEVTKETTAAQGGPLIEDKGEATKKTKGAPGIHSEFGNPPYFTHP
jgi:hypothetical protein